MQNFGYHTFSELWPEDYDNETDTSDRLKLVADTVEYINNNTVDWVHAYKISQENYTNLQRRYDYSVKILTELLG